MFKRIITMWMARNREFLRDRAAFGWNVVFPFLLVAGFAIIFGGKESAQYKVGVFPCSESACVSEVLLAVKYVQYVPLPDLETGLDKLNHHKIDLLLRAGASPYDFWVNDTSPNGYIVQRMIAGSLVPAASSPLVQQPGGGGKTSRYIDWFFPGVVGMNMMFSALYGVGYVIVRYRKNGVLKRLHATPLTAFEYLSAQMLSRLCMIALAVVILWTGCSLIFHLTVEGSYLDLAVMLGVGSLSLISLGLVVASRCASEELADGLLNAISWPMMFLSGVWFSIEGAPGWVVVISKFFPLTHMLAGVRKIMNDGVPLSGVMPEIEALLIMTALFLGISALAFKWHK